MLAAHAAPAGVLHAVAEYCTHGPGASARRCSLLMLLALVGSVWWLEAVASRERISEPGESLGVLYQFRKGPQTCGDVGIDAVQRCAKLRLAAVGPTVCHSNWNPVPMGP